MMLKVYAAIWRQQIKYTPAIVYIEYTAPDAKKPNNSQKMWLFYSVC